jgi:hypothetical protein
MSGATSPWQAIAIRLERLLGLAVRPLGQLADAVNPVASSPPSSRASTTSPEAEDRERQLEDRERELRMLMAHWM